MSFPRIPTHLRFGKSRTLIPIVEASPGCYRYSREGVTPGMTLDTGAMILSSGVRGTMIRVWNEELGCFVAKNRTPVYPVWGDSQ